MSDEGAKERVLKIFPDAFRSGSKTIWSRHSIYKVNLGKSWEDAAPKLPQTVEVWARWSDGQGGTFSAGKIVAPQPRASNESIEKLAAQK